LNIKPALIESIPEVAELLCRGGVIVYPTETVYGLGCIADDALAAQRITAIKFSRLDANFLILVRDLEQTLNYAESIPTVARTLAQAFWPGSLTLILPALMDLPGILIGPGGGVAMRVSPHPWVQALMAELGVGLISTSANLHGYPAPAALMALDQQVGNQADLVVDGGRLSGVPSTVLDLCGERPRLVRAGVISREAIEVVVGKIE
jgi:L-threonylcarbamoyladenylate synthase